MWITVLLILVLLLSDQVTKYLAQILISEFQVIEVIPNFLNLTLIYNKGAAWGFLSDNTIVLVIISFIGMFILGWFAYKNDWKKLKTLSLGVTLAFAGCVGNLIDRLFSVIPSLASSREGVVDMIILKPLDFISNLISGYDFPIFNLADVYLVIGVILISIDFIILEEKRKKKNEVSN